MSLSVPELLDVGQSIAEEYGDSFRVLDVVSVDGDTDRAEMLLSVTGCHAEECRVAVNVDRASAEAFDADLRRAIRRAFDEHRRS